MMILYIWEFLRFDRRFALVDPDKTNRSIRLYEILSSPTPTLIRVCVEKAILCAMKALD